LLAELSQATARLHSVEKLVTAARIAGERPPAAMRAEHLLCRRSIASLRHMLAAMPDFEGGCHVASA
jgi:hypothetical protein